MSRSIYFQKFSMRFILIIIINLYSLIVFASKKSIVLCTSGYELPKVFTRSNVELS